MLIGRHNCILTGNPKIVKLDGQRKLHANIIHWWN